MRDNAKIVETVFSAIEEINEAFPALRKIQKSPETILFGASGILDSLGLVNLIVTTERKIEDAFGVTLTLADEKAMSQKNSPFRTVQSLVDYIVTLLKEKGDG